MGALESKWQKDMDRNLFNIIIGALSNQHPCTSFSKKHVIQINTASHENIQDLT